MSKKTNILWANEGGSSVKALVDLLAVTFAERVEGSVISPLADAAFELMLPEKDWRGAAITAGWAYDPMAKLMHKGHSAIKDFETADWKRLCVIKEIEPDDCEGVDYLIVSDWLVNQLKNEGEKVMIGIAGMNIWANMVEGPAVDNPVIVDIAEVYANKLILDSLGGNAPRFEVSHRGYTVSVDPDKFTDLEDSESYVTGNAAFQPGVKTLLDKLTKLRGVRDVDHSGHFGSHVYMTIDDDEDDDALKAEILEVIDQHLDWCATLEKAPHVVARRRGP